MPLVPTIPSLRAGLWATAVAVAAVVPAAARERIAMPYSCHVQGGRVMVGPAPEQQFLVSTPRQQQPYTFCINDDPGRCRTWMTHRFNMVCGGKDVPWIDVVAAAASSGPGLAHFRARVEHGRLALELGPRPDMLARCHGGPRFLGGRMRPGAEPGSGCPPDLQERHRRPVVVFPAGFAPMGIASARVVLGPEPVATQPALIGPAKPSGPPAPAVTVAALPPAVVAEPPRKPDKPEKAEKPERLEQAGTAIDSVSLGPLGTQPIELKRLDLEVEAKPRTQLRISVPKPDAPAVLPAAELPPVQRVAARETSIIPLAPWTTVVSPVALPKELAGLASAPFMAYTLAAVLSLSLLLAALYARRQIAGRAADDPRGTAATRLDEQQLFEIVRSTTHQQLDGVRSAIRALSAAPPLRSAITDAMHVLERRYQSILQTAPADDETRRRTRARLERVLHDLRRLREIGESAVVSFTATGRMVRELPRTRLEAFEMLGVNPDVDMKILKKLVDALRQSWHPDLAKSDDDRRIRDERIKEINIAWELIVGKRADG